MMFWLVVISTFFCMEGVTWLTHKYVMHGLLWTLHRDHHQKNPNVFFERNDAFFLIFALPAMLLIAIGTVFNMSPIYTAVGAGITMYGFAYFVVHEIIIHQRFRLFTRTQNTYLRAIRKAHKVHHKHLGKEEGECFGMLWVPVKYFKDALKTAH